MGKTRLVLGSVLLLAAIAGIQGVRWLTSAGDRAPRSYSTPTAAASLRPGAITPASRARGDRRPEPIDPNLPLYRGDTRRLAAQAIDDTALAPMNQALIGLARRSLGLPYSTSGLDRLPSERLLLDLQHVDQLRFVENLLALVNSRQVSTRTEAVDRFSDHVRQLRYEGSEVAYCRRHRDVSRWALAAERRGYLVNLTPFLPGARSRRRPLILLSSPPELHHAMQQPANGHCPATLVNSLAVDQAYVPLANLSAVLPSLRSGDLFILIYRRPDLEASDMGVVEVDGRQIHAIHAIPGSGVRRSRTLARFASRRDGVIGLSFHRPVPNSDGRANR